MIPNVFSIRPCFFSQESDSLFMIVWHSVFFGRVKGQVQRCLENCCSYCAHGKARISTQCPASPPGAFLGNSCSHGEVWVCDGWLDLPGLYPCASIYQHCNLGQIIFSIIFFICTRDSIYISTMLRQYNLSQHFWKKVFYGLWNLTVVVVSDFFCFVHKILVCLIITAVLDWVNYGSTFFRVVVRMLWSHSCVWHRGSTQ